MSTAAPIDLLQSYYQNTTATTEQTLYSYDSSGDPIYVQQEG